MKAITRHMSAGGRDYRQRLTLTFVPGRERRYKEIYCISCSRKVLETYDDLAYVSDVDTIESLVPDRPSAFGLRCQGGCRTWYEIKTLPGVYNVEATRMFFFDPDKKRRELHCSLCKEFYGVVNLQMVFGTLNAYTALKADVNGFVPTFCPARGCEHEYEITTSIV